MEVIKTAIKDCYIIKPKLFGDTRGFFMEAFNKRGFANSGIELEVKQINFAKSSRNVLRGLHYQLDPMAQSKLVGVFSGAVIDVAVDIREHSPTFKQYVQVKLEGPDTFLLVPSGCAHGYYSLADDTLFYYAVDNYYSAELERGIRYDDPELGIDWGLSGITPTVSEKDLKHPYFLKAELSKS